MTVQTLIMPFASHEAPPTTPASDAFLLMLTALTAMVTAERDLADISYSQDPAYSAWMQEAEAAQQHLSNVARDFMALPHSAPEDRPLFRMALLIDAMLTHEEPGGARDLHLEMQVTFFQKYQVTGVGAKALSRNILLIQARHLVDALAYLPLFDFSDEAEIVPDEDEILTFNF